MGRRLRSPIPDFAPRAPPPVQKRSQRSNRGSTEVPLAEGQVVRIRDDRGWHSKHGRWTRIEKEQGAPPPHLRRLCAQTTPRPEARDTEHAYSSGPSAESEETYLQAPAQSNFVTDTPMETGQLSTDQGTDAKRTRARQPPARLWYDGRFQQHP